MLLSKIKKCVIIILLLTIPVISFGQDGHYWTEQFGNKSMLLSGTVNANVNDLGLVYYNPGRLAQIENPAFVISAKVYELLKINIVDGLGEGEDLKISDFGGAPNLIAGTFKLPFLKNHHFAYSYLTRYRQNSDFNTRSANEDQNVGETYYEHLSAKMSSASNFNEDWLGITWSYAVNEKLSVGLSTFGTQTKNSGALEVQLQGLTNTDDVHMVNFNRQLDINVIGLLWKAGLATKWKKINMGLTITTPRINFSGSGSSVYEDFITGIDSLEGEPVDDIYIENHQEDLSSTLKSPLAIGAGISFKLRNSIIHLSGEWFDKVNAYTLMESEPFEGQSTEDTITVRLVDDLKSVFNFGIGFEYYVNEKFEVYGSFATDFSAVNSDASFLYEFDATISNSKFEGEIFHFGGGVNMNLKWAELTLGATYASSARDVPRPLNIGGDEILGSDEFSSLKYSRLRFIVGFSFPFATQITDKLNLDNN